MENSQEVLVSFGMQEGFIVNIPSGIYIDSETKTGQATIEAAEVILKRDSILQVMVSGHDYIDKWELIDNSEDIRLHYTIGSTKNGYDIHNNSILLSISGNDGVNLSASKTIYFTVIDEVLSSGNYSDVLTFTVDIHDVSVPFEDYSWEDIVSTLQSGYVPANWQVGDSKTLIVGNKEYKVRIIGRYHDEYADGSGLAPLTLQLIDCYDEMSPINQTATNAPGWSGSYMRTVTLENIFNNLPEVLQEAIRPVKKYTIEGKAKNPDNPLELEETHDKLFLLSEYEVLGTVTESGVAEGKRYEFYANGGSAVKNYGGSPMVWWLRTPRRTSSERGAAIYFAGQIANGTANTEAGVAFAFCI